MTYKYVIYLKLTSIFRGLFQFDDLNVTFFILKQSVCMLKTTNIL